MTHRHAIHGRGGAGARGFTLMELLVVLTIFSMVVTTATDIFLLTNRSQRKIFGLERTQADARYTLEAIAREVRTGSVDYAYYAGRSTALATPDAELALIDATNSPLKFKVSDASNEALCADANSRPCLLVTVGSGSPSAITPKNVAVRTAKFYVSPGTDPMSYNVATGAYASNVQPHVTIVLVLESRGDRAGEQSVVYLQTTATSRGYKR